MVAHLHCPGTIVRVRLLSILETLDPSPPSPSVVAEELDANRAHWTTARVEDGPPASLVISTNARDGAGIVALAYHWGVSRIEARDGDGPVAYRTPDPDHPLDILLGWGGQPLIAQDGQ